MTGKLLNILDVLKEIERRLKKMKVYCCKCKNIVDFYVKFDGIGNYYECSKCKGCELHITNDFNWS